MNILMTGATGLIGRHFIDRFDQHSYTILTRNKAAARVMLGNDVHIINELTELTGLDDFDAVINLAGEPIIDKRWSAQQKQCIRDSRWQITQQLVELFKQSIHPPKVFLSASAIGVYSHTGQAQVDETQVVTASDFPSQLCEQWEHIAQAAAAYTRVVTLRTGIVLAVEGGALAKMLLPFKLGLGGSIGRGKQGMSWIHYRDHIHAMQFLLEHDSLSGPVNLTAPQPVSNAIFSKALAKALNRWAVLPVPPLALKLLLGESSALLLDSQFIVPNKLLAQGFKFKFADIHSALHHLVATNQLERRSL